MMDQLKRSAVKCYEDIYAEYIPSKKSMASRILESHNFKKVTNNKIKKNIKLRLKGKLFYCKAKNIDTKKQRYMVEKKYKIV